jgi:hypothetical protein
MNRIVFKHGRYYPQFRQFWIWWDYQTFVPVYDTIYGELIVFDTEQDAQKFFKEPVPVINM